MLIVKPNGEISLTRGDTARLNISIANDATGQEYSMGSGDVLHFTVKRKTTDSDALIHKEITNSTTFHIEPQDTSNLKYSTYRYDVQLSTSDGDVYTIIPPNLFTVLEECTW